ncbi:hypothetical protein QOT17_006467 [Balamuthia mandrillaris]
MSHVGVAKPPEKKKRVRGRVDKMDFSHRPQEDAAPPKQHRHSKASSSSASASASSNVRPKYKHEASVEEVELLGPQQNLSPELQKRLKKIPSLLEQVDPFFRTPINYKSGEWRKGTAADKSAVEEEKKGEASERPPPVEERPREEGGGFNPLPKVLEVIQSDDSTHARQIIEQDFELMDQALATLLQAYGGGINQSIENYSQMLGHFSKSRVTAKLLKEELRTIKLRLFLRTGELHKIWSKHLELEETLRILNQVDELHNAPDQLKSLAERQEWVKAAETLKQCVKLLRQEELSSIGALYNARTFILDWNEHFHQRLVEELHKCIYLSNNTTLSIHSNTPVNGTVLPQLTLSPRVLDTSHLEMEKLVNALLVLDHNAAPTMHQITNKVSYELHKIIDSTIVEASQQRKEQSFGLRARLSTSSSATSTSAAGSLRTANDALVSFMKVLLEKLYHVLRNHKHVASMFHSITKNIDGGDSSYNIHSIWDIIQTKIVALLHVYFQASSFEFNAAASVTAISSSDSLTRESISSSSLNRPKRRLFSFADSSAATFNVSGQQEQDLVTASFALFKASPYNVCPLYPLLSSFIRSVCNNVLLTAPSAFYGGGSFFRATPSPRHSSNTNDDETSTSHLRNWLNTFINDNYLPFTIADYRRQLVQLLDEPDAFKPSKTSGLSQSKMQLNQRPLLHGIEVMFHDVAELHSNIVHMAEAEEHTKTFMNAVEELGDCFYDRCNAKYGELLTQNYELGKRMKDSSLLDLFRGGDAWERAVMFSPNEDKFAWRKRRLTRELQRLSDGSSASSSSGSKEEDDDEVYSSKDVVDPFFDAERVLYFHNFSAAEEYYEFGGQTQTQSETSSSNNGHYKVLDVEKLQLLANLSDSLEWLAHNLRALFTPLFSPTTNKNNSDVDNNTVPNSLLPSITALDPSFVQQQCRYLQPHIKQALQDKVDRLCCRLQSLSEHCLLALKIDHRLRCFYRLDNIRKVSYVLPTEPTEPDSFVAELAKDLNNSVELMSKCLPSRKTRFVFHGLDCLLSNILINSLPKIRKINQNGVLRMCKNAFCLQQCMTNATTSIGDFMGDSSTISFNNSNYFSSSSGFYSLVVKEQRSRDMWFERVRKYYGLLLLSEEELLSFVAEMRQQQQHQQKEREEDVKQKENAKTKEEGSKMQKKKHKREKGTSPFFQFLLDEYKAILHQDVVAMERSDNNDNNENGEGKAMSSSFVPSPSNNQPIRRTKASTSHGGGGGVGGIIAGLGGMMMATTMNIHSNSHGKTQTTSNGGEKRGGGGDEAGTSEDAAAPRRRDRAERERLLESVWNAPQHHQP